MGDLEKTGRLIGDYFAAMDRTQVVLVLIGLGLLLIIVTGVIAAVRRKSGPPTIEEREQFDRSAAPPPVPPPPSPLIAEMVEVTKLNGFGGFCVALLVVTWAISILAFIGSSTAFQEIMALLIWIGGNTMFGLAAILNREKTYKIYRR